MAGEQAAVAPNGAPSRAAILAEMSRMPAEAVAEPTPVDSSQPAAESAPVTPPDDAPADAPSLEAEAETPAPIEDAETSKRLATVQKQEQRLREQIAKEKQEAKAEIAADRAKHDAEWSPRYEQVKQFEALKARARRDPAAVLTSLGLNEADFEAAARQIFAMSPAAKSDPAAKAHAEKMLREREQETSVEQLRRELAEIKQAQVDRDTTQTRQAETARYVTQIEAAAKTSPAVSHLLNADADEAHTGMSKTYERLMALTGEPPDAAEVVAEYEKIARAKLAKLGVNLDALTGKKPEAEPEAKRTTKTLSTGGGTTAAKQTATPKTPKEERDEVLRELRTLKPANDD